MLNDKLMNIIPQYMKSFALNIYYGVRQWLLQYMLFLMGCKIVQLFGESVYFGRFGLEGIIIVLCMFLYTMLYYCFKAFAPRLHPLLQIIIPYILYALMVYCEIVMENDWNFKIVTIDYYMLEGWLMPLYSLMIISLEHIAKKILPNKAKRILKIVWNTLTILLITLKIIDLAWIIYYI